MLVSLFPGSPVKVERFSLLSPFLIGQDRPFLKTCMQVRRNGIHAERLEWNTCNEPERRLWHWLSECAGDKSQSKCKEEALRCLSSLDIKSFRSAKEK